MKMHQGLVLVPSHRVNDTDREKDNIELYIYIFFCFISTVERS